jgi:hypothetical protein
MLELAPCGVSGDPSRVQQLRRDAGSGDRGAHPSAIHRA